MICEVEIPRVKSLEKKRRERFCPKVSLLTKPSTSTMGLVETHASQTSPLSSDGLSDGRQHANTKHGDNVGADLLPAGEDATLQSHSP